MQSFNIILPDAIANALSAYIDDQEVSLPANVIVENALEEFLSQRGYLQQFQIQILTTVTV